MTLNLSNQTEGFTITGSAGADSITGGSGNDTIIGAQNDTLLDGGGGTDTLQIGANFTSSSNAQIVNIEKVTLTAAGRRSIWPTRPKASTSSARQGPIPSLAAAAPTSSTAGGGADTLHRRRRC